MAAEQAASTATATAVSSMRRRATAAGKDRGADDKGSVPKGRETQDEAVAHSSYALTRKILAQHNQPNNAWVAYGDAVYDITTFIESHPGGPHVLEPFLGKDVSEVMMVLGEKPAPAGAAQSGKANGLSPSHGDDGAFHHHSHFARKLLEKHRIGTLIDAAPGTVAVDGNVDPDTGKQLVDWSKPILHQVGMLGHKYDRWIHSFPTTDSTVKMFTNDTLEGLTKCPWYVPLLFWIPVMLLELVHYFYLIGGVRNLNPVSFFLAALSGGVFWLLVEYSLHRWIFHFATTGYWANIGHFLIHGHHHITPMDFDRLVFPPVPAMILAGPFWVLAPRTLGVAHGYPWLIGLLIGYLVYDMTHFWIHHGVPSSSFLKMQKRRHVHHHYFKPDVNFGISNPLFDVVFGTLVEPQ